jgi:hypothetical protein
MLVLTADGARINNGAIFPFDQVLNALAALPRKAWTQGRLILYYNFPPGISDGRKPSASTVKQVEEALKAADIKFIPGASA